MGKRIKRIANPFICICGLEWMMNMIKSKLPVDSWNPKEYAKKQNIEIDHILRTTCNTCKASEHLMPAAWTDRPYEAKQRGTRFKKIKRIIIKNSNITMSGDPIMFLYFNSNWVDNILVRDRLQF